MRCHGGSKPGSLLCPPMARNAYGLLERTCRYEVIRFRLLGGGLSPSLHRCIACREARLVAGPLPPINELVDGLNAFHMLPTWLGHSPMNT